MEVSAYIEKYEVDDRVVFPVWVNGHRVTAHPEGRPGFQSATLGRAIELVAKTLGVTVFDLDITPQYHSHVAAEADEPDSWVITVPG